MAENQELHIPGDSRNVARAAVRMALSASREEERQLKAELSPEIRCAAVDCGGEFISSVTRIVERAVVAAKREGLVGESHLDEGAVAGATHEALMQIVSKATGLNIGGKIGIARAGDHIVVAVFFGIGLLHLNEVAIALGHRVV
ncbi:MAG: HutP family protein [Candidatus Spyradocola sp.]|nr:HutP family protein [Candidatus Spyradocola sp.]